MILDKTTSYPTSFTLSHEELDLARASYYDGITVKSEHGKRLATFRKGDIAGLIAKPVFMMKHNGPDKEPASFWVVNFPKR